MIDAKQDTIQEIRTLNVSSPVFVNNSDIPVKYTCDGENVNPPLSIGKIPANTKSLVIIVDDPDAPFKTWIHWIVWNIMPVKKISEKNSAGVEGTNDFGQYNYEGPCPPSGTHHYHFKVYALDEVLNLKLGSTVHELEKEMSTHIIAFGELIGVYKMKK